MHCARATTICLLLAACGPDTIDTDATSATSATGETGASSSSSGPEGTSEASTDAPTTTLPTTTGPEPTTGTTGDEPACTPDTPGKQLFFLELPEGAADVDGVMQWTRDLALGDDGVAYVGGAERTDSDATPMLFRVGSDGALLTTSEHETRGPMSTTSALVRAPDGTVHLAGFDPEADKRSFIASFAGDGPVLGSAILPGDPKRELAALTSAAENRLVAVSEDDTRAVFLTEFNLKGKVFWDRDSPVPGAEVAALAIDPAGRVAATHGLWNPGPDTAVGVLRLDGDGTTAWSVVEPGVDGPGAAWDIAFAPDGDVLVLASHYNDQQEPFGHVELIAFAAEDGAERWRTLVVSDPQLFVVGHTVLFTAAGAPRVVYTKHDLSQQSVPVGLGVAGLEANGELKFANELSFDLSISGNRLPQIAAAIAPCETLLVFDAVRGELRKFQL